MIGNHETEKRSKEVAEAYLRYRPKRGVRKPEKMLRQDRRPADADSSPEPPKYEAYAALLRTRFIY
jgi:hypothetical protein